jgi:hypothetical protein
MPDRILFLSSLAVVAGVVGYIWALAWIYDGVMYG